MSRGLSTIAELHCALAAAQCVVMVLSVCMCVCVGGGRYVRYVCLWVCYHDNSKLCVLILTKLGLLVKVVTISS